MKIFRNGILKFKKQNMKLINRYSNLKKKLIEDNSYVF